LRGIPRSIPTSASTDLTSFFDVHRLQQLWTRYESGDLDSEFPQYAIEIIELDEQGTETSRHASISIAVPRSRTPHVAFKLGEVRRLQRGRQWKAT